MLPIRAGGLLGQRCIRDGNSENFVAWHRIAIYYISRLKLFVRLVVFGAYAFIVILSKLCKNSYINAKLDLENKTKLYRVIFC
jgi:hypothetical protein